MKLLLFSASLAALLIAPAQGQISASRLPIQSQLSRFPFDTYCLTPRSTDPSSLQLVSQTDWQPEIRALMHIGLHRNHDTWTLVATKKLIVPAAKSPFKPFLLKRAPLQPIPPVVVISNPVHFDSRGRLETGIGQNKGTTTFGIGPTF